MFMILHKEICEEVKHIKTKNLLVKENLHLIVKCYTSKLWEEYHYIIDVTLAS